MKLVAFFLFTFIMGMISSALVPGPAGLAMGLSITLLIYINIKDRLIS